jgi:histidyl-tRNA synthetase
MKYTAPRGTHDYLPGHSTRIREVLRKTTAVLELYGFAPIDTPVFEASELFSRSIGDQTDIVSKEMYTFADKKGRSLTLRPEGTASVVRAYVEHNLDQAGVERMYYFGPMFRYERPTAGRQRQFYQLGVEIFGDPGPAVDAETIELFMAVCKAAGLTGLTVQLNSVGCPECRGAYRTLMQSSLASVASKLCGDCQVRLEKNPLRVLDCKVAEDVELLKDAPSIVNHLCQACRDHFDAVQGFLTRLGVPFTLNPRLVRGLDYYNRTAFEIQIPDKTTAQNAVGGGGRYDLLVEQLGGKPTPAIGFAIGWERFMQLLESQSVETAPAQKPMAYVAWMGAEGQARGLALVTSLRNAGIAARLDPTGASFGKQFKSANKLGASLVAILGPDEVAKEQIALKDMVKHEQSTVSWKDGVESIRATLSHGSPGERA